MATKKTKRKEVPATVGSKSAPSVHLSNTAPTQAIATELQNAFDYFNTALFGNKLGPCVLKLDRLRKYVGYFRPKQWTTDRKAGSQDGSHHEIRLDPDRLRDKGDKIVLSTLVHEMMHQIVFDVAFEETGKIKRPYHCKNWAYGMNAIGLTPLIVVKGKVDRTKATGANATHEIVKGGDFDKAADDLLKRGFKLGWLYVPKPEKKEGKDKPKAGAKVAYVCGECEAKAWGKPELQIVCGPCEQPMKAGA